MARKRVKTWDSDYSPYGTYEGPAWTEVDWAAAFSERMGVDEAHEVLGADAESAWSILGIKPGSSFDTIKSAFRKLAFKTHPDHGGNAEDFKRIRAAFSLLMGDKN